MELARLGLFNYIVKSEEELLVAVRGTACDSINVLTNLRKSR